MVLHSGAVDAAISSTASAYRSSTAAGLVVDEVLVDGRETSRTVMYCPRCGVVTLFWSLMLGRHAIAWRKLVGSRRREWNDTRRIRFECRSSSGFPSLFGNAREILSLLMHRGS